MCENGEQSSIQLLKDEVTSAMCELLFGLFFQNCIDLTDSLTAQIVYSMSTETSNKSYIDVFIPGNTLSFDFFKE